MHPAAPIVKNAVLTATGPSYRQPSSALYSFLTPPTLKSVLTPPPLVGFFFWKTQLELTVLLYRMAWPRNTRFYEAG